MSKVGLLTNAVGFTHYYPGTSFAMRIGKITDVRAWDCYGSRVQLPTGILVRNSCLWIVTDRGSELHNECSLLVFGHENMVST